MRTLEDQRVGDKAASGDISQVFSQKNLTFSSFKRIIATMDPSTETQATAAKTIRARIEKGGERIWRLDDFSDLPAAATAQALSRLAKRGLIQRLSRGTYYHARESTFGRTRPNPSAVRKVAAKTKSIFPAGVTAANQLGFTTQTSRRAELSTSSGSVPKKLIGQEALVHTRRPQAWNGLTADQAAILEFLRRRGRDSELSPEQTLRRIRDLLSKPQALKAILKAAPSEPPRVRAIIGALGEELGADRKYLNALRASLNPLSKFDFGIFAALPNSDKWQAKKNGRA